MLTKDEAYTIARNYLQHTFGARYGDNIVILDERTVQKPKGWVFIYQHLRYLQTRKVWDALIGNGPILVDAELGKIVQFGSAGSLDYWYDLYREGKTREDENGVIHLLTKNR